MAVRIPSYRYHKATGLAVVTIQGHDFYLGRYGSAESRQAYGELIAKHAAGVPLRETPIQEATSLTVEELILVYLSHAKGYYQKNGEPTDEYNCICSALQPLKDLYGQTEGAKFNRGCLKAVRERMIDLKWSRGYINKSVSRIRRMFRHAVLEDLLKAEVLTELEVLPPLLRGRCRAKELPRRTNVPQSSIDAVRNDVNQHTRDLMDLALLTGARPGELCKLTGEMLDRSGDVWTATLEDHKMVHKDKIRILAFGPQAQLLLRRYLKADPAARLFPIKRSSFSNNIKASCERLGLPRFTGHWLRHNAATEIRKESGLDGAQVMLGHSKAETTEIYAHVERTKVIEIARKRG